jgi:hypothetical protein
LLVVFSLSEYIAPPDFAALFSLPYQTTNPEYEGSDAMRAIGPHGLSAFQV